MSNGVEVSLVQIKLDLNDTPVPNKIIVWFDNLGRFLYTTICILVLTSLEGLKPAGKYVL